MNNKQPNYLSMRIDPESSKSPRFQAFLQYISRTLKGKTVQKQWTPISPPKKVFHQISLHLNNFLVRAENNILLGKIFSIQRQHSIRKKINSGMCAPLWTALARRMQVYQKFLLRNAEMCQDMVRTRTPFFNYADWFYKISEAPKPQRWSTQTGQIPHPSIYHREAKQYTVKWNLMHENADQESYSMLVQPPCHDVVFNHQRNKINFPPGSTRMGEQSKALWL